MLKIDSAALESVLFVLARPVKSKELMIIFDCDENSLHSATAILSKSLGGRGIRLIYTHDTYQLVSAPQYSDLITPLIEQTTIDLSPAMLEVVTIVAHQQPISQGEIEHLRGVASDKTINNLLALGLIKKSKSSHSAVNPIKYLTTMKFLRQAGLKSIDELNEINDERSEKKSA